jgi:hypothetical protein
LDKSVGALIALAISHVKIGLGRTFRHFAVALGRKLVETLENGRSANGKSFGLKTDPVDHLVPSLGFLLDKAARLGRRGFDERQ